jgi:hypothetical protein
MHAELHVSAPSLVTAPLDDFVRPPLVVAPLPYVGACYYASFLSCFEAVYYYRDWVDVHRLALATFRARRKKKDLFCLIYRTFRHP